MEETPMSRMPTTADVEPQFERLQIALDKVQLEREEGKFTRATSDEFMLMQFGEDGEAQFKHRDSRNYVYLFPNGRLFIPKTEVPFNRGLF
jgi:hypothetical protein